MCKHAYVRTLATLQEEDLTWDSANFHMVDTLHDRASQSETKTSSTRGFAYRVHCLL